MEITFLKNWETYHYLWLVERREDTFLSIKDNLVYVDIDKSLFDMINKFWCKIEYDWVHINIIESLEWKNRYIKQRKNNYPPIEDYIDAKVKQSSSIESIVNDWLEQEKLYFMECLRVKEMFPKP